MLPDVIEISPTLIIPVSEMKWNFVRSSGAGGQHVNKVSTKVELYFNVKNSPAMNDTQRSLITEKLSSQLDAKGNIRVVSQTERSQLGNRLKAIHKLQSVLKNALKRPRKRKATKPTLLSNEERLIQKKARGAKLKSRRASIEE